MCVLNFAWTACGRGGARRLSRKLKAMKSKLAADLKNDGPQSVTHGGYAMDYINNEVDYLIK